MGLFTSNKNPCPVCGGATPRLLATKIEGQPLCGDCAARLDMDEDARDALTLDGLRRHFAYLDENQALRDSFSITKEISFGFFTHMILDGRNRLLCMNNIPNKTVFRGSELRRFTIKEDESLLFAGAKEGFERYESFVPAQVASLAPQIQSAIMAKQLNQTLQAFSQDKERQPQRNQYIDIREPFHSFTIELYFDHPYHKRFEFSLSGPTFDSQYPDSAEYMREYYESAREMEELAVLLMDIAFPGAGTAAPPPNAASAAAAPQIDSVEALKRFKALLDEGIITQEEFAAKKKQLLGI